MSELNLLDSEREVLLEMEAEEPGSSGVSRDELGLDPIGEDEDVAAGQEDEAAADEESGDGDVAAEAEAESVAEEAAPEESADVTGDQLDRNTLYAVDLPEDLDDQIKAVGEEKTALREKFSNGDLTEDEYEAQREALTDRHLDLRDQKTKAETILQLRQQSDVAVWQRAVSAHLDAHDIYKMQMAVNAFDAEVKSLANDPENASRDESWFISEAHQKVAAQLDAAGLSKPKPAAGEKPGGGAKPAAKATELPPTLSGAPAAELTDTGAEDEFAYLDRLDGVAAERALSKLTPDQLERYGAS